MIVDLIRKYKLVLIIPIVILLITIGILMQNNVKNDEFSTQDGLSNLTNIQTQAVSKANGDVNIHFYRLGEKDTTTNAYKNANAEGDSFIIVVGDVEILVDGGTDIGSAPAIMSQMQQYVSDDNVWDYIIVTHADKDHIGAFCGETLDKSIFQLFIGATPVMSLNTLIDFDITKDETNNYPNKDKLFSKKLNSLYSQYCIYREMLIASGVKYYTASQCLWEQRGLSSSPVAGATNEFKLNKNITLNILYNYYCDHKFNPDTEITSADKNNLCVCFTIDALNNKGKTDRFLFAGDLEEYDSGNGYAKIGGESKLVENNPQLNEGVVFYKASHHGSRTSSSKSFIDAIRPQSVVVPCIAGNNSNGHIPNSPESFPALVVTNRLFKYTDRIFVPTVAIYDEDNAKVGIEDYYGNIDIIYSTNTGLEFNTTNNFDSTTNEPVPIQNTEWFRKYRQATISSYTLSSFSNENSCPFGNCSLVKYGHYDILIDCGVHPFNATSQINSEVYINKIRNLCVDGILEYVIVSSPNPYSTQQIVDTSKIRGVRAGILSIFKIENIIDFGDVPDPSAGFERSLYAQYQKQKQEKIKEGTNYLKASQIVNNDIEVTDGLYIDVLHNDYYETEENSDICLSIKYRGKKMMFLGNNRAEALDNVNKYGDKGMNDLKDIVLLQIPSNGEVEAYSKAFYNNIMSKTKDITFVSGSILKDNFFDRLRFTKTFCDNLVEDQNGNHHNLFVSSQINKNNKYEEVCGDIVFSICYQELNSSRDDSCFDYFVNCSNNKISIENTAYYKQL